MCMISDAKVVAFGQWSTKKGTINDDFVATGPPIRDKEAEKARRLSQQGFKNLYHPPFLRDYCRFLSNCR